MAQMFGDGIGSTPAPTPAPPQQQPQQTQIIRLKPQPQPFPSLNQTQGNVQSKVAKPAPESIAGSETTTSTTYGDLATSGPSATVNIRKSGLALLGLTAWLNASTAGEAAAMAYAASGASTQAATDIRALIKRGTGDGGERFSVVMLLTGLDEGETTFTAKYKSSAAGSTATFADRDLWVLPF